MNDYPAALWHAWKRRRRDDWPPTLDACMAHRLYAALVRMEALHGTVAVLCRRSGAVPPEPEPEGSIVPSNETLVKRPRTDALDRKRLASGERDSGFD